MTKRGLTLIAILTLLAGVLPAATMAEDTMPQSFKPVATFVIPGGGVAEIVSATPDGEMLIYTDAGAGEVGFVDISDPRNPVQVTTVEVGGEPTSVAVTPDGAFALVVVITSDLEEGVPPVITPGQLVALDLRAGNLGGIVGELAIGNHPDSIALSTAGGVLRAVIAIENQPVVIDADGNLTDDEAPGLEGDISGPGYVQIVDLNLADLGLSTVRDVGFDGLNLAGLGLLWPDDPQPEFVEVHGSAAAVTLQENNGVALLDIATASVTSVFSSGSVSNRPADLHDNDSIAFVDIYPADVVGEPLAGARMPDAIAWSPDGRILYTADEGEFAFTGGRGFSWWTAEGELIADDAGQLEAAAVRFGHYPDGRSDAKGIEVEGIETAVYGGNAFLFVGSERGSFLAVYDINDPADPRFIQILPTGISPEGLLALPQRGLFVTSEEVTGTMTIFEARPERWAGEWNMPTIVSRSVLDPWAALSGLAADPNYLDTLYAVPDNAAPSAIYRIILTGGTLAPLYTQAHIWKNGEQAFYDFEGVAIDPNARSDGRAQRFWAASEGNAAFGQENYTPNVLVHLSASGQVLDEIYLPAEVDSATGGYIRSNGYEGVTVSSDGRYLLAAIQREFAADESPDGVHYTRIARYDLHSGQWDFFLYPLDAAPHDEAWVGLSEIANLGNDVYAVIERDNQLAGLAAVKKVYTFTLVSVAPYDGLLTADASLLGHVIAKTELADLRGPFAPFEKIEGLALTTDGWLWAALDNDGGEVTSRIFNIGQLYDLDR